MNKLFLSLLIFSNFSMHAMDTDGSNSDTSVELGIDSENNGLLDTKKEYGSKMVPHETSSEYLCTCCHPSKHSSNEPLSRFQPK